MNNNKRQKACRRKGLFTFLLAVSLLFTHSILCANVFSQKKLDISMKDVSLIEVLKHIDQQSEFSVLYRSDQLEKLGRVSVNLKDASVEEILNQCLQNTGLSYRINDKTIVITKQNYLGTPLPQQNMKEIKGKVIDSKKEPLIGATIMIKGTTIGVVTNENGEFSLKVPENTQSLTISFIGYKPMEVNIAGKTTLNVTLEEDVVAMDDVVVTGYFSRSKNSFTGAVKTITKDQIMKVSTGNIFTTLNNLDPSFKIEDNNSMGSDPNHLPEFNIRGKGSYQNSSTSPIFIMDGFQVDAQKVFDMDINRIESITILKDASATILYGSRAANGVVVIETRAPEPGKLRVTYTFKPTIAIADLTDYSLMNAAEKLEYERLAGLYKYPYSINSLSDLKGQHKLDELYNKRYADVVRGVNTYWLKQPVRNAFSHEHSLFVEGGDQVIRYGIDVNYNQNGGVMKESGRDRFSLGFNLIYRIKDKVTLKNYAEYSHVKAYNSPYGQFSTYAKANPYEPIRDENGEMVALLSNGDPNPLWDAALPNRDDQKTQTFTDRFNVDWYIQQNLRLKGSFQIQKDDLASEYYRSPRSSAYVLTEKYDAEKRQRVKVDYIPIEKRGEMVLVDGEGLSWTGNVTLSYDKTINGHTIFVGLGGEANYSQTKDHGYTLTGFPDDRYYDPAYAIRYKENTKATSSEETTKSVGAFINLNYIYDNRYFADFSFREDGSSQFGADNKFAPFYSLGAGWNIHNEKFWSKDNWIDLLKLRFSYGSTGNQEFSAYQAKTTYEFQTDQMYYNTIGAVLKGYGNANLKWQKQYMTNIGLDFGMFKGRVQTNLNYYIRKTSGMLTNITVAPSLGFSSNSYKENLGEIENRGFEVNLNAVLIRKQNSDLEWAIAFQGATNKSKLLEISKELKGINEANNKEKAIPGNVYEEGESMTAIKAVRSLGIDPGTGNELYLTKDDKVTTTWDAADKVICGDTEPKFFGNVSTNVYYKGFNLNAIFAYTIKADLYNQTLVDRVEGADPAYNADTRVLADRWKVPGDHTFYKNIADTKPSYVSSRFIQEENTFALKSVSLSYDFKREWLQRYRIENLRLSFYMNDVFRISSIEEERGLTYPFARSFVFGLNIGF